MGLNHLYEFNRIITSGRMGAGGLCGPRVVSVRHSEVSGYESADKPVQNPLEMQDMLLKLLHIDFFLFEDHHDGGTVPSSASKFEMFLMQRQEMRPISLG
jgi:hypothetical protein